MEIKLYFALCLLLVWAWHRTFSEVLTPGYNVQGFTQVPGFGTITELSPRLLISLAKGLLWMEQFAIST